MARTTGTVSLADLINSGKLLGGEKIVLHRRSAPPIEGLIQPDGSIKIGKATYKSPSAAAKDALRVGQFLDGCDGM